ncbi:MAG TPA: sulfite exporter TauE/SafE family protein [Solirubrobacteraceae bacterium]|nr:sulfite exporter TauE/SafE family protein [Solirubrobacteraceae bacterium]
MSPLAVAAACAVMAGAALQSSVGFGFALVAAPLLFAAASPAEAVGLMIVLGLEVSLLTLLTERRRPEPAWRDVAAVVAWSLPGALAGVAVLRALDELALQLLVTAGVLSALVVNLRAARRAPPPPGSAHEPPRWARPAAGLASGALNTSTSNGGPPVVLLLMSRGLRPGVVRDTLTAAFVGLALVSAAALLLTRTGEAVPDSAAVAALIPLTALGHVAGRPLFARLAAGRAYERVLTAVLLATVAVGLLGVLLSG